jgi:hypothetical protein
LSNAAPDRAAAATAPATVFGMSWNFRSRKTREIFATSATREGPSDDEGLETDLQPPDLRPEPPRGVEDLRSRRKSRAMQIRSAGLILPPPLRAPALSSGARADERSRETPRAAQ